MIIQHKDSCWGFTLFRFGRRQLQIWFVPADYACEEHTHQDSDGEFFVVYGKGRNIYRNVISEDCLTQRSSDWPVWDSHFKQQYNISTRKYFKWFTVKKNTPHGFSRGSSPMLFLCWQTYRKGVKVTSPAIDFHPVTN